jgi:hypothetical protein
LRGNAPSKKNPDETQARKEREDSNRAWETQSPDSQATPNIAKIDTNPLTFPPVADLFRRFALKGWETTKPQQPKPPLQTSR